MKKSGRRLAILALAGIVLMAAIAYYAPLVKPINKEMLCFGISEDGDVFSKGQIQLEGWKLDYLFKEDQLVLEDFSLPGISTPKAFSLHSPLILMQNISPDYATGFVSDGSTLLSVQLSIQENYDTWLIKLDDKNIFVCVSDDTTAISQVLETHKWLLKG